MILADENIHNYIIKSLREAGVEVFSIGELAKGIKDDKVIELALNHGYILLTEDKDFGEWVFAHHIKGLTVLFLRYSYSEFPEIAKSVTHFLINSTLEERPFFATITTKKIRMRKL